MKDPIVTILVIIALSAVSSWIKRKSSTTTDDSPEPWGPPQGPEPRTGRRSTLATPPGQPAEEPVEAWKKEVRRLFDLEPPQPSLPQPAGSPPAVPSLPPHPGRTSRRAIPDPLPPPSVGTGSETIVTSTRFSRSDSSQSKARALSAIVAKRMEAVDFRTTHHQAEVPRFRNDRWDASAWTTDSRRLKEAFVAGMILGPPKALD